MITILRPFTLLILLLIPFSKALIAAEYVATIAFFRAIQDTAVYARNPAKYEHLVINDRTGKHEYYIEKEPAHVIPKSAIESVTVREAQKFTATGEPFPETKPNSQSKRVRRVPKFYELTFKIRAPDGKRFSLFTKKNSHSFFETIIGKESIGLQEFDWPFEPDESGGLEFQFSLRDDDGSKLKELLSPFKDLVIWK